jgi:CubicO group peptidase (beta-lactamase class C family)
MPAQHRNRLTRLQAIESMTARASGQGWYALAMLASASGVPVVRAQHATPVTSVKTIEGATGRALHARMMILADSGWSGAVVVERRDTVLLAAGYGLANRAQRIPFTTATVAQVGSLTKQFTAAMLADLVQRGKLRYTDSLGQVFSGLPAQARGLTIAMLLTHTAGLADACGQDFAPLTRDSLLHSCLARPFAHPPGSTFQYSNMGYSVLGAVAEQVSGESLESYLEQHFFAPLHLSATGYQLAAIDPTRLALGYNRNVANANIRDQLATLGASDWNLKGNGGMQSSVDDMYGWYRALEASPLFTEDERHALFSPHAARDSSVFYGYGWFLRQDANHHVVQISHTGSDGTFVSLWYWRPVDRVFIYTVSNFGETDLATGTVAALRKVMDAARM